MKVVVVYESHWGNTAAVAEAIAEGIGPEARALTTSEATREVVADADLIVAGSPVLGFQLPKDDMIANLPSSSRNAPSPPDVSHPSLRSWLASLPQGTGLGAAFETRIWWSLRGATETILAELERAGYRPVGKGQRFVVTGTYGPLREGELERARLWGEELARLMQPAPAFV